MTAEIYAKSKRQGAVECTLTMPNLGGCGRGSKIMYLGEHAGLGEDGGGLSAQRKVDAGHKRARAGRPQEAAARQMRAHKR